MISYVSTDGFSKRRIAPWLFITLYVTDVRSGYLVIFKYVFSKSKLVTNSFVANIYVTFVTNLKVLKSEELYVFSLVNVLSGNSYE